MNSTTDKHDSIFSQSEDYLISENSTDAYGLDSGDNNLSNEAGLASSWMTNFLSKADSLVSESSKSNDEVESIVFIDSAVPDKETLIDNVSGATEVVVLDKSRYELVEISEHLSNYQQLDSVHIVSLGEAGQISFNNNSLNLDTLSKYAGILRSWGDSLSVDADIVLYGCDIAFGSEGNSFLRRLNRITGADVLASTDKTGFFGDWELEATVGQVESGSIFQPAIKDVYLNTLDSGEITITPGTLPDFSGRNFYNTTFDFNRIAADDLVLFANANLDFGTLNPNSVAKFDFRDIPTEDLSILTEAGLSLNELDSEAITDIDYTDIPAENLEILTRAGI